MIQQVSHAAPGAGAADLALALGVAYALHGPVTRAAEVAGATPAPDAARRTAPTRTGASRTDAPRTAASRGARRRTRPARRAA
ncbi:hypothetical protein [Streptomyces galbus]|nr:hypothetical protein [Streptomyces galbus]GHD35800.1 hypothetical protein GCM10010335_31460 [Streptomyces galbus]